MTLIPDPTEIWRELFSWIIFIAVIDLYVYFFSWWVDTLPESSNWDQTTKNIRQRTSKGVITI